MTAPKPQYFPFILISAIFGAFLAWFIMAAAGFLMIPAAVGKILDEIYNG